MRSAKAPRHKRPGNVAARALRLFKPKAVAVKNAYSRKAKHRARREEDDPAPGD